MGTATQYTNALAYKPPRRYRTTLNPSEITNSVLRARANTIGIVAFGKCITPLLKDKRIKTSHFVLLACCGIIPTLTRPCFCLADLEGISPYAANTNSAFIANLERCGYIEKGFAPATHHGNTKFYALSSKGFMLLHSFKRNMEAVTLRLSYWADNR